MQGTAHLYSAHYDKAFERFSQSFSTYFALEDDRHSIDQLNNMGTVHYYRGDYAHAHSTYKFAEGLLSRRVGQPWYNSAAQLTAANLATLYQRLGRYQQALRVYQSLGKQPAALSPPERAQFLSNLAVLNRRLGDPWKARDLLRQALALLSPGIQGDAWLGIIKNLGILLALDFHDLAAAENLFRRALHQATASGNAREAMQSRLYLAEVYLRLGDLSAALDLWQSTLAGSQAIKASEDEWRSWFGIARVHQRRGDRVESWRAFTAAIDRIESLREGIASPTLRTEFLADKMEVYEEAIALLAARGDVHSAFRTMERARALALHQRGASPSRLNLAEFQSRLRPGEAALLYHAGKSRSFLLWVTRAQAGLRPISLTESQAARSLDEVRANIDAAPAAKRTLAAALLDPLTRLPGSIRRLWIVPDGILALLPFEILPFPNAPLIERFEVVYLPAASLLRTQPPPSSALHWPWQRQLVAYADPDVAAARLVPGDERWKRLPESGREVANIARVLPGRTSIFLGTEITPSKLILEAAHAPILHLATHGAGDAESAARNRLLIGPTYLYGADLRPDSLRSVQLAVLSACETDTGPVSRGEGVQSLARAFLLAGAGATVASLWKVDDAATRLLMEEFYLRLAEGMPVASALRQAKLRFLHSPGRLRQPHYWAAFIAQGDAANPLPRWLAWPQVLTAIAFSSATLVLALWLLSKRRSAS